MLLLWVKIKHNSYIGKKNKVGCYFSINSIQIKKVDNLRFGHGYDSL